MHPDVQDRGSTGSTETPARPKPVLRGWSHLVGAIVVPFAGLPLALAANDPGARALVGVYVVAIAVMLGSSAIYHVPSWSPERRRVLRRVDHSAIFVGIAGTYTPIAGLALGGTVGTVLLVAVWVGAVAGIVLTNWRTDVPRWVRAVPYVGLGWVAVLALPALWGALGPVGVGLLAGGGVLYTVGAVVYAKRWPDPRPRTFGFHEVFHVMVLAAVACHWAVVAGIVR